jgi:phosphate transport system substrate-binding protein
LLNKKTYFFKEKIMRRNLYPLFAVIMLAAMVLGACSTAATPTPVVVQQTVPVEVTQIVMGSPVVVTATPGPTQPPAATPLPAGSVQINAGGATFPQPIYAQWTYAYQYVDPSVAINYQGIGSGGGIKGIEDGTLDFAGSDATLAQSDYDAHKDLQMYPAVAGAVVVIYNVGWKTTPASGTGPTPTATPAPALILDRQTLVGIYNAKITKWNDPAIVALNPAAKDMLPDAQITVVHRSDGSGTTQTFTKALTSFSTDWTAGAASSVNWPVDKAGNGVGGKGNPGVAAAVINTKNSLGYVELDYAVANNIPFFKMINKAGQTVVANAASLASAMSDFNGKLDPTKLTVDLMDAPGAASWPIATYTYYILHTTTMTDCVKAQKILQYIQWTLTDPSAAAQAHTLGYNTLPPEISKAVIAKLGEVTCNGNPVLK